MSKKLIALVATAVMLNGIRTIIQPGQELPDMTDEDEKALLSTGMAQDPAATAALDTADAQAQAQTQRAFQEARDRVRTAQATIAPEPTPEPAPKVDPAAEPSTPAKKAKATAK